MLKIGCFTNGFNGMNFLVFEYRDVEFNKLDAMSFHFVKSTLVPDEPF